MGRPTTSGSEDELQGKDIAKKGAALGAVVTVQCHYTAVSHAIGIIGITYQMNSLGGARVATVAGILLSGNQKAQWWIPSDQYALKYGANKAANIAPKLMDIREEILAGTYNVKNSAPKCTIQQAHQVITKATSPCKVSKCKCAQGTCKVGCCRCIRRNSKCTSACTCNGGCAANPNNGK